jgi:thiaminase (transcriptional activator TenA)
MTSFSASLRTKAQAIWRRELEHPFVRGMEDGTLPAACFKFYMCQDYLFLIDYCRVFALASAKAPDLATMRLFARLLHETLHTEMELHRQYCVSVGIASEVLEGTKPTPVTLGYTRHLLTVAHRGALADIVAAVLPCQWGYAEIGQALAASRSRAADTTPFDEWIRAYASAEFAAGAEELRRLLDRITQGWPPSALAPLEEHFLTSSRYEYLFWDMAYAQSDWPI